MTFEVPRRGKSFISWLEWCCLYFGWRMWREGTE